MRKGAFEKGYEAKWRRYFKFTVFLIETLTYKLRDLADEVINGIFYEQELTRVEKNLEEEQFIVDRMIKSRGRGLVKC